MKYDLNPLYPLSPSLRKHFICYIFRCFTNLLEDKCYNRENDPCKFGTCVEIEYTLGWIELAFFFFFQSMKEGPQNKCWMILSEINWKKKNSKTRNEYIIFLSRLKSETQPLFRFIWPQFIKPTGLPRSSTLHGCDSWMQSTNKCIRWLSFNIVIIISV